MAFQLVNSFLNLKGDVNRDNYPRAVVDAFYSFVATQKFPKAKLLAFSSSMMDELELNPKDVELIKILTANQAIANAPTYACNYGGHQFGSWAGQLGDGRAITLAEIKGKTSNWTLQLKGAGPTPYSRRGDGYAVLRSSIREYLMSEAMYFLGVPTTRALSLVKTGEVVMRDRFYNGNPKPEPGALVARLNPHFIRFGSFELLTARGEVENLKTLADYTLKKYYPQIELGDKQAYLKFFEAVSSNCVLTTIKWQMLGFVHGVLNTDNMSITGETIDYGPYGFLDQYEPGFTPNTTDFEHRRYRYIQQPNTVLWNLLQLANALYPLVEETAGFERILKGFKREYELESFKAKKAKLGLVELVAGDEQLIDILWDLMERSKVDFTLLFRLLCVNRESLDLEGLTEAFYDHKGLSDALIEQWKRWISDYKNRLQKENVSDAIRIKQMKKVNPKLILRNYMLDQIIEAAEDGDYSLLQEFNALITTPYADSDSNQRWFVRKPDSAPDAALSCSS